MTELLDSGELRLVGYIVAAAAAIGVGGRERRSVAKVDRDLWPTFWFLSALLLLAMGVARAVDLGDIISDVGRERAESSGWYESRRWFQAATVGTVATIWGISVVVAIWRVPERRRRYLPAAIVMFTLVCFASVRIVSLRHIDALLYNRDLSGVRVVAVAELALLATTITTMFWFPFTRRRRHLRIIDARSP